MFRGLCRSLPRGVIGLVALPCAVLASACSESAQGAMMASALTGAQPGVRAATTRTGLTPALIVGKPTCADASGGVENWLEASLDRGEWLTPGTYATHFRIHPHPDMANYLNWSTATGIVVRAVLVEGGAAANLYGYAGAQRGAGSRDTQLHSPLKASGKPAEISRINFCYTLAAARTGD